MMKRPNPSFTVGIEEEYMLVEQNSRALASDPPDEIFAECERRLPNLVKPEFLKAQIESNTPVCKSVPEARNELAELRQGVSEIAEQHGYSIIAASTHPFAEWQNQSHTDKERYNVLAQDLQAVVRRLLICGMHVHVGIDDDELRIDLLNQVSYFLPHILALSTSSPFWQGELTGLKSYRLSVFDELPRTGIPDMFDSYPEYERHVNVLVNAGLIEDSTKLWWDVRPSQNFPTLELRISDLCTNIDDAASIAALFSCLMSMLHRLKLENKRWRQYAPMLISENRWRAQRYGIDEGMVDFGKGEIVPFPELLEELMELIAEDAETLGCVNEIENLNNILKRGTSAHRQVAVYEKSLAGGADKETALKDVVDFLIEETKSGL
jgi:glutamate---cysteine ligase / carboxylate-amine ligase